MASRQVHVPQPVPEFAPTLPEQRAEAVFGWGLASPFPETLTELEGVLLRNSVRSADHPASTTQRRILVHQGVGTGNVEWLTISPAETPVAARQGPFSQNLMNAAVPTESLIMPEKEIDRDHPR